MHVGSAFQLNDDLLDYDISSKSIGKNIGDDLSEGKPTLPLIYAMQHGVKDQVHIIRTAIKEGRRDKIDQVIAIIHQTGAIEYTLQVAKREVNNAKAALSIIVDSTYKDALLKLADFSIKRTY